MNALIDLPLALSPVVVGLALFLVYGRDGLVRRWLGDHGIQIIFALPAMVLATIFVSLPFVVREVVPVLREIGTEQEEAAATLGAARLADVLARSRCRRSAGRVDLRRGPHDGARARRVRCGARRLRPHPGRTETLTLHVQERYQNFDLAGAYAVVDRARADRGRRCCSP